MLKIFAAAIVLVLVTAGCAGDGGALWQRGETPSGGGAFPLTWPCQASG